MSPRPIDAAARRAIRAWNVAQERCKAAYDAAPDAFAQVLRRVCFPCKEDRHARCTGRATEGGRAACRCWVAWHKPKSRRVA